MEIYLNYLTRGFNIVALNGKPFPENENWAWEWLDVMISQNPDTIFYFTTHSTDV